MNLARTSRVVASIALSLAASCGGGSSGTPSNACAEGTPGCRCYGNGTCNPGLTCNSSGICGGPAGTGGGSGDAGVIPDGSAGVGGGSGGGNYMDECHADLRCWGGGGSGMQDFGDHQLRKVGGQCLLNVRTPSVQLNPDGSTSNSISSTDKWYVDSNDTLYICDDDHACWFVCRTDSVISFPCSGSSLDCEDLNQAACQGVPLCTWTGGACTGFIMACDVYFDKATCETIGCTWSG